MSLMPYQDLKFLKHLLAIQTRYSPRDMTLIKQALNSQVIKFQLQNPFAVDPFPILNAQQLPHVVLYMGRQMEEFNLKNFSITALEHFAARNFEPLVFILSQKNFHCLLFCQAVLRYMQEAAKSRQLSSLMDKIRVDWLVKLVKAIFQARRGKKVTRAMTVEMKESNHLIHVIFNALYVLASVKYLREFEEEDLASNEYIATAATIAFLLVEECEKEEEFGGLREYLSVCSHLLIFNGWDLRPLKWLEFCLENNQALGKSQKCGRQVSPALVDRYLRCLVQYSKLDFEYQLTLLKTVRNLLGLNIGNGMLIAHFQILMELIRIKIFPFLKKQVFDILLECQNKRNITVVDQIFMRVLSSGIDLLDDDIQRFALILAQNGQAKRKEQFVLVYYYLYEQASGKIQSQVINLILEVYLEQELPIEKVELMVAKEANCISSDNLKKLHAVIGEKKMNLHLSLLAIILEKRRDSGAFKISKKSANSFLNDEWLTAAAGNAEVYKTYLKLIVETLCGKSLEINPSFINLGSCVVKVSVEQHSQIQGDYFLRSSEFYSVLVRVAEKQDVFEENTFRYMVLLQAILGERLPVESYSYFSKNFSRVVHPQSTFLAFLEYLVVLLKNKSSVLLYLQAVLEFQTHCNQLFFQRRLFDLSFMARMVEQSEYFRLSTYSMQSVTILYELSLLVRDQQFQQDYLKMMKGWSMSMSRADCKHLAYFFAFREIKQIYPFMREREMKDPSDRIRLLWDLILKLTAEHSEKLQNYLIMGGNKIVFEWKGDEFVKKGIKITGSFIRNHSYELSWFVHIQTKDKLYTIWINNDRLIVEEQQESQGVREKEKLLKRQQFLKDLKKRPQVVDFQIKIENQARKISCSLRIAGTEVCDLSFDGSIHQIRIGCKSNALLKHILVSDGFLPGQLNGLNFHASILNRWEVRTASLAELTTQSFGDKFDFDHAYCCIGEMLRHFQHINLPFAYDIFVRLSGRLIAGNNPANSGQIQLMMQVFGTIESTYSSIRGRSKPLEPVLETDCLKGNSSDLFYLFVAALLPLTFWQNFSTAKREQLRSLLLLLLQAPAFRILENSKLVLFEQALRISAISPSFFQVCELIVSTHQFTDSRILTIKFSKLMHLARQGQPFLNLLSKFLQRMLQYLNLQNGQFHQKRLRCKYLIVESANIKDLFQFCTIQSKIALLHYYSQNPSFNERGEPVSLLLIKELVQSIQSVEQKCAVMPWLIIQIKQVIFRKKSKTTGEETRFNPRIYHLYLELLLLNRHLGSQEEREDVLDFILEIVKILKSDINSRKNENEKREVESYFHSSTYFSFILQITKDIIARYGNVYSGDAKDRLVLIYTRTMEVISRFQKKNFLEFMIKYRFTCSSDCKLLKAIVECQQFKSLRLRQFSIFLQYLFEILLLIEQKSALTYQECEELIKTVKQYLEFVFTSLDTQADVPKALFYCFPRLSGRKQGPASETTWLLKELKRVGKNGSFVELRGGVYFKCVLIICKLMRLCSHQDYNNLVEFFLFGPKNAYNKDQRNLKYLTRASIGLYSTSGLPKQRSAIEIHTLDVYEGHKLYFNKEDYPQDRINEEVDLTAYVADYFLMTIAEFLQQNADSIDPSLLQRYSNNFLRGSSNQRIVKDLLMSSQKIDFQSYDDVEHLLTTSQFSKIRLTRAKTYNTSQPLSPVRNSRNAQSPLYDRRDSDFLFPTNVGSPVKERFSRKNTEDFTSQAKRRADIFDWIHKDCKSWYKRESCKNVSKFFCEQAKEIRILELLHTHYVLKAEPVMAPLSTASKTKEGGEVFQRRYAELLRSERKILLRSDEVRLEERIRKVKKIFPYTSSKPPVLSIIQNCLPNMTCPITLKITKQDYDTRKNQESIYMNFYLNTQTEDESLHLTEEVQRYDSARMEADNVAERWDEEIVEMQESDIAFTKEKPYCEWITRQGVYFCQYHFDSQKLVLTSKPERPNCDNLWYLKLGTPVDNLIKAQIRIEISPDEVVEIFQRRFNQITNNSLQFFLKNGSSKFISFYRRSTLAAEMRNIQRVFHGVKIIKDSAKQFQECKFSDRWAQGTLSNFDYLMLLNKYSGRTYNDLNQYYVFPWVLKDYYSEKIDLTNPDIYRDLSKPIGAINPEKLKRYREKYKNQSYNLDRCLYGSHYSTSLFVFYYLVRLQPFSSLHRQMQKGNWDVADRLFNSIEQVWDSLTNESNTSDIKECIPQFYYFPAFLKNIANIQFGQKQCGSDVGDVQLPRWAENADQLVLTLRAALQSDTVSETLHHWIDLIFGKYQNSQEKHNIFHPYSYSDPQVLTKFGKNSKNIEGVVCQISYFGQCPLQLFKKQHKPKKTFPDVRPNRASYTGKSESTASQIVCGEASLLPGWKIAKITCQGNEFILDLKNTATQERLGAIIPAFVSQEGLKERLEDLTPLKKNEPKITFEPKLMRNQRNQLLIGNEFLMDLDVKFHFDHSETNQVWIACFGCRGLRLYNWQLQQKWSWQIQQVKQVHLESTRFIFSTPSGKLYFYSFLQRKLQEVIVFKDVCDMTIKVIALPRLPSRQRNQSNYKILCIGDNARVSIVSYCFQEVFNYTSQIRSLILS